MTDNSLGDADFYDLESYAGIGKRFAVQLIDLCVLVFFAVIAWLPFMALILTGFFRDDPSGIFWIIYLVMIWIYLAPIKRSFGTVGYRLLGLKIVAAKGGVPSLAVMTARMLMWILGPFNFLLDLVWIAADTERQSLRDCYLGTYVVNRSATPLGRGPLHLTRYNSCGMTLAYPRVRRPASIA